MSSPPRPRSRLGRRSQPTFLELSADPGWQVMSTRGQSLPGLLRRYSMSEVAARYDLPPETDLNTSSDVEPGVNGHAAGAAVSDDNELSDTSSMGDRPRRRHSLLIGDTASPFRWSEYLTPPEKLAKLRKPLRKYYERMNFLVVRYMYVDRLLDSSIARDLLEDYERHWAKNRQQLHSIVEEPIIPGATIAQEPTEVGHGREISDHHRHLDERTPLLLTSDEDELQESFGSVGDPRRIVRNAIYVNLLANVLLLAAKIAITVMTSSVSIMASLVDAALDFLSTAIIWSTTRLTARRDRHRYPIGRQRLEPVGVLIFSTVMITSFFQVAILSVQRLTGDDHAVVELGIPAIVIMASTVAVKFGCWIGCRRINDSNVQALAQDAMTDIVFNIFSIVFPLVGMYANFWFLDSAGGLVLSIYVMGNWARTAKEHIAHLTGSAASLDERSVLLYLVMRFAKCIRWIQNLEAYHSGDRLNVEVDVVLDENTTLHDSHDVGESLQHMLESVSTVDRAFVHLDYASYNLPTHIGHDTR